MGRALVAPVRGPAKASRSAVVCTASAEDARRAVRALSPPRHAAGASGGPPAAGSSARLAGGWTGGYSPSSLLPIIFAVSRRSRRPWQVVSLATAASVTLGVVGSSFAAAPTAPPLSDDTKKNAGASSSPGAGRLRRKAGSAGGWGCKTRVPSSCTALEAPIRGLTRRCPPVCPPPQACS